MKSSRYFILALSILFIFSCKKKDTTTTPIVTPPSPTPTVSTTDITNITDSTAVSGGNVTAAGTAAMLAVGICWDTLPNPTTLRNITIEGAGTGSYISKLTGLKPNKTYYVKAYATNYNGTAYGNEITLKMPTQATWRKASNTYTFNCLISNGVSMFAGTPNGIIFSSDTGSTWTPKGLSGNDVNHIARKNNLLFATTQSPSNALYKSSDNGVSWSLVNNFPNDLNIYNVVVQNSKVIVGTDSSAFYSADDGSTWNRAWDGMTLPGSYMGMGASVFKMASSGQQAYAAYNAYGGGGGGFQEYIAKYNETNNEWESVAIYIPQYTNLSFAASGNNFLVSTINQTSISQNGGNFSTITNLNANLNLHADGSSIIGSNSTGYFAVSKDQGNTWGRIKTIGLPNGINYFSFISTHYLWVNTTDGLYKYKYN